MADQGRRLRYAVRKLDIHDIWWFIVDLTKPRAAILDPEAVVDKFTNYTAAKERAAELNQEARDV